MAEHFVVKIDTLVPEIVNEQDEQLTDIYIDAAILSREPSAQDFAQITSPNSECTQRILKIKALSPQIQKFVATVKQKFSEHEGAARMILDALKLALKLHINDRSRSDSALPGVSHQIRVAEILIEKYDVTDPRLVVCGLLHDAVEDQARLLGLEAEEVSAIGNTSGERARDIALHVLGRKFGYYVEQVLTGLSVRERDGKVYTDQHEKNRDYYDDVFGILLGLNELTPVRAMIKMADLEDNALTIGKIRDRALAHSSPMREELMKTYEKFKLKYKPVLRDVRSLIRVFSKAHPLYAKKQEIISRIDAALADSYS